MEELSVTVRPISGNKHFKPFGIGTSRVYFSENIGKRENKIYWDSAKEVSARTPKNCVRFELNFNKNNIFESGFIVEVYDSHKKSNLIYRADFIKRDSYKYGFIVRIFPSEILNQAGPIKQKPRCNVLSKPKPEWPITETLF